MKMLNSAATTTTYVRIKTLNWKSFLPVPPREGVGGPSKISLE
jgi:hypothetical protein